MSIIKNIRQQVQAVIQSGHTDPKYLQQHLWSIIPTLPPTSVYPNLNQVEQKEAELVYASLTVQDILDTEYYYAYLIKKPVEKGSEIVVLKYGLPEKGIQNIQVEQYQAVMEGRETLVCVGDFYESQWVGTEWKGMAKVDKSVNLKVSGKHEFRLGQKINAVCVWNPEEKHLIFVRLATQEEVQKMKLDFDSTVFTEQLNIPQTRKKLIESLQTFCTKQQALMVLYSLISDEPMFINGQNISSQLQQLMPRVCHIKIKAPFKGSLFPYKNPQGMLVRTPMQMSMGKSYVIVDFSEFSEEKEIKIQQAEIDNLKALKMFVEEGKTIYRWEYGESLIDHVHSGIIVKGSKIVTPHYHLAEHLVHKKPTNNPFTAMKPQQKQKLRVYLKKCLERRPKLTEQARQKIQAELKQQIQMQKEKKEQKQKSTEMLHERLQLARLNAKSMCRDEIEYEDYVMAGQLLELGK